MSTPAPEDVRKHYNFYTLKDKESRKHALITLMKRKHSLLSVCFPSAHDSFKRTSRVMVLLFSLATMFAVSAIMPFVLQQVIGDGTSDAVHIVIPILINTFLVTLLLGPFKTIILCTGAMDKRVKEQEGCCFKWCSRCCACFVKFCCGFPILTIMVTTLALIGLLGLFLKTDDCVSSQIDVGGPLRGCFMCDAAKTAFDPHGAPIIKHSYAVMCAMFGQCGDRLLPTSPACCDLTFLTETLKSNCSPEDVLRPPLIAFGVSIFVGYLKEAIQLAVLFRVKGKKQVAMLNARHRKFSVDKTMRRALKAYKPTDEEKEMTGGNEEVELEADDMDEDEVEKLYSTAEPPSAAVMQRNPGAGDNEDSNDDAQVELTVQEPGDDDNVISNPVAQGAAEDTTAGGTGGDNTSGSS